MLEDFTSSERTGPIFKYYKLIKNLNPFLAVIVRHALAVIKNLIYYRFRVLINIDIYNAVLLNIV
jgi:hypothetical protein